MSHLTPIHTHEMLQNKLLLGTMFALVGPLLILEKTFLTKKCVTIKLISAVFHCVCNFAVCVNFRGE